MRRSERLEKRLPLWAAALSALLLGLVEIPAQRTVFGIDVSYYQGPNIDWEQVCADGKTFAFVRASGGTSYEDPYYIQNMTSGRAAGLHMGSYHYPWISSDPSTAITEVEHFISVAGPFLTPDYMRPVLDVESGYELGREALSAWVETWLTEFESRMGFEPLIYTNTWYATNFIEPELNRYDLWFARYNGDPQSDPPSGIWEDFFFLQYSNTGSVAGISGAVDLDVFTGTLGELQARFLIPAGNSGLTLR
ncbi:glycoside hydrolase family 25 protein [Candidatus Sumerlaeota bacterium]|nr:glycoside hydrolase family 25 protein [Candidatus Sumerlaeota bacterium]